MRVVLRSLKNTLYGILISLFTVGFSVILTLNFRFIYEYCIDKYKLEVIGQLSKEMLMNDFNNLINYLQNPFISKLQFNNFPMSASGEIHFYEVKKIFLYIYLITIFILLFFITTIIYKKIKKKNIDIHIFLNYGANILICTILVLISGIFINFSRVFIIFHKIFFNNDYWIFNEKTDPIISVLPEELFKLYALIIVALVVFFIFIYKFYYYRTTFKSVDKCNKNLEI